MSLASNLAHSIPATSVGKVIAERAPSQRALFLAEAIRVLPKDERKATVYAALDILETANA